MYHRKAWMLLLAVGLATMGCNDDDKDKGRNQRIADHNDPAKVVCMGDCITGDVNYPGVPPYPVELRALRPEKQIHIEGGGAAKTGNGRSRVGSVLSRHNPGWLLILYGVNDTIHRESPAGAAENLRAIVQAAKAHGTIPIIGTLPGMSGKHATAFQARSEDLSARIRQVARDEGIRCVDLEREFAADREGLLPDGRHPGAAGVRIIAVAFSEAIR
ncbi:MAG: SGNH/GDSL hydrolase family protein [Candidatus Marinimicrobia bacterium]|nr:SGNH/GDSL hydrolase family protein [Candidatus Neomarinimicrobiota bacterium]